jgi:uncharacterized membrane protein YdjX (TVP38/TMEM64 family)
MAVAGGRASGLRLVALAVVGFGGLVAAHVWAGLDMDHLQALLRRMRDFGSVGWLALAMLQLVVAVSGILPASLLGIAAGAVYGFAPGFGLAALSTMGGGWVAFALSRSLFRPSIERMLSRRPALRRFDARLAREGWKLVLLLRLSPAMPFSATSYALGLSQVGSRDFLIGTLASLPALAGYVAMGALANAGLGLWGAGWDPLHWGLLAIGLVATVLLTLHIGRLALLPGEAPGEAAERQLSASALDAFS